MRRRAESSYQPRFLLRHAIPAQFPGEHASKYLMNSAENVRSWNGRPHVDTALQVIDETKIATSETCNLTMACGGSEVVRPKLLWQLYRKLPNPTFPPRNRERLVCSHNCGDLLKAKSAFDLALFHRRVCGGEGFPWRSTRAEELDGAGLPKAHLL